MRVFKVKYFSIILLSIVICCQEHEDITSYLNQVHNEGNLNGNVLILQNGNVVFEDSYGFANPEKTIPLTRNYRFQIGSIYKEFPAVSIMILIEKGHLNLKDKISQYLPWLPNWSNNIEIIHLLQYSSGLPIVDWNSFFENDQLITIEAVFSQLNEIENLQFEPGSDYVYSNFNPMLLIKIVEKISGNSYTDFVKDNLLTPFEMRQTTFEPQYPYKVTNNLAIPFNKEFEVDTYRFAIENLLITTSARDLATWTMNLTNFEIISQQSVKLLSEESIEGDNIQAPLGRCDWKNNKLVEHFHHGSSGNFEALIRNFNSDNIVIIILTNQKQGNLKEISSNIYKYFNN